MQVNNDVERTMSDIVVEGMEVYGNQILGSQIPHIIDGLKCINRRIIVAVGNTTSKRTGQEIVGQVKKTHFYGDKSIREAVQNMAQPFRQTTPLIDVPGSVGTYSGDAPPETRYMDIRTSAFIRDVLFTGVNHSMFKQVFKEDGSGYEPEYLIPRVPMALLTGNFGMGFGHKSNLAPHCIGEVCTLVQRVCEHFAEHGIIFGEQAIGEMIYKYLIPDFPVHNVIRNVPQLLREYQAGNYDHSVRIDGTMQIEPNKIIIRTLPYGVSPKDVYDRLGKILVTKDRRHQWFIDNVVQVNGPGNGVMDARIAIILKRGIDPFGILEQVKNLINYELYWTPSTVVMDLEHNVRYVTPVQIVIDWYKERRSAILGELKYRQNKLIRESYRIGSILKIVMKDPKRAAEIYVESSTPEAIREKLVKEFDLTAYQARELDVNLKDMSKSGKAALEAALVKTKEQLKIVQVGFLKIDQTIHDDVVALSDKYRDKYPRVCGNAQYVGAVHVHPHGYIQCSSIGEIDEIMHVFGSDKVDVIWYPVGPKHKVSVVDGSAISEHNEVLAKEFRADHLSVTRAKPIYSIKIVDGHICRVSGIHACVDPGAMFHHVGQQITTIDNSGTVARTQSTSIPTRNTIERRGPATDIEYLSPVAADDMIVVYVNSNSKNSVRLARILGGSGSINKLATGTTKILGIYRGGEQFMFSVPGDIMNRCSTRHIHVTSTDLIDTDVVTIDLSRGKCSNGRKLSKKRKVSSIYTLK